MGEFPADVFDGRFDPDGHAAVAKLGGPILARLIVVSNRVAVPSGTNGNQAGGLAVAVRSLLRRHRGIWFGWSGTVSMDGEVVSQTIHRGDITYVVTDLVEADYFALQAIGPPRARDCPDLLCN